MRRYKYIRKEILFEYIRKNQGLTSPQIVQRLKSNVRSSLRKLLEEKKIYHEGGNKFWRWYVEEEKPQ